MRESKIKDILRILLYPILTTRRLINLHNQLWLGKNNPKKLAEKLYKNCMGHDLDWNNPQDLNAKINWLKFYGDTRLWSLCADKYRVRKYVKEKGLESILVPLYGHWDKAEDINWETLPDKFVMKVNNGCGDVLICKNKKELNIQKVSKIYDNLLKLKFWFKFAEPHYEKIKPCIIAEELLDITKQSIPSSSLIDYKIWCFNGKPYYIFTCHNRTSHSLDVALYDTDWNSHSNMVKHTDKFRKPDIEVSKPDRLEEMLEYASLLSDGFPQCRVDLYDVNDHIYFGEMTLSSQSGFMDYFTNEFLEQMGNLVILSKL